jgi:serine/threonine protein kinase
MNSQSATFCRSSDVVFDQILEEITARLQAGNSIDENEYAAEYPEYADRLQQLLPAMQALMAFGRSQGVETVSSPQAGGKLDGCGGILGDFRIIRELGRGGMGVVYEAEQISIGRAVALKVLPFASMLDDRRLARFRNEVRAAGQLHHTNIVPIYAVGSERGVHFYAMQLVVGQTLAEIIVQLQSRAQSTVPGPGDKQATGNAEARQHQANVDTARAALSTLRSTSGAPYFRSVAELGIQAAEALEHAHSCGIVHRDIKPSNLIVDERGTLWLTDFGLASIESGADLTLSGDLLGTLRYMSPEQTFGSRVILDHRTDIYSLGATLYELLTLKPAFDSLDRGELLRQIAVVEPQLPHRIAPAIPQDLETIILKAMSKDAAGRYTTAGDLALDLRRFMDHKPIQARRPSLSVRVRKWIGRHAALVAITAGALAVVATMSAAAAYLTLTSYRAEAKQRTAAEANLAVASQIIERMVSRVANDRYYQGNLKQAETLAADATNFYEELLKRSNDPDLRYQAALAYRKVAGIWQLVGRYEKAGIADRRANRLIERLTTQYPGDPKYLVALADNYNQIGMVDWALDRPSAAEPAWRQSWEIWTELAERFPQEPSYQYGVARMLANLGCVCYFTDRYDEAEEYYRRADVINKHLPDAMKNSAEGLASHAGSLTNQAELARLRGDYDRAIQLLEASIPYHQQTLAKWPTNPVALDCFFYMFRNMIDCHLDVGRHADAAATVERLIETFPDRLEAYQIGIEKLQSCAVLANEQSDDSDHFVERAHELVSKAYAASQHTLETSNQFAWLLLTCKDESFRDAQQALALAKSVVEEAPERGDYWFTLALAEYRNGDWQAAEDADNKSIELSRDGQANVYDWLLLAMIRAKQNHLDEARQLNKKAADWIIENKPIDQGLLGLAAEAKGLAEAANPKSLTTANTDQPPR